MALMKRLCLIVMAFQLAACVSNAQKEDVDNKKPFLLGELVPIYVAKTSDVVKVGTDTLIASYRDLLKRVDDPKIVPTLLGRVAQLELLLQDQLVAEAEDKGQVYIPDYSKAIHDFHEILRRFPQLETNDQIYYQLAKAYDMGGQGDKSLYALTQLVRKYPKSKYYVEAEFRRGDYLFGKARYREARGATKIQTRE